MKLNLGCGTDRRKDCINIDKEAGMGIVGYDLNELPYPFRNDSCEEIHAYHILEHLFDFEWTMRELHRILKKGGRLFIKVPHFTSQGAYQPYHIFYFNFDAFNYLCGELETTSLDNRKLFNLIHRKIILLKGKWLHNHLIEPIINLIPRIYESCFLCYLFPAKEVFVILEK